MTPWSFVSQSQAMTRHLGWLIGEALQAGSVVALIGPLGAGKTELVHGLARGLDVPTSEPITSPTYSIVNPYRGRLSVYHLDLYRLGDEHELQELGFSELLSAEGILLIEWADRFWSSLPKTTLVIRLEHRSPRTRTISLSALGPEPGECAPVWELIAKVRSRLTDQQASHKQRRPR